MERTNSRASGTLNGMSTVEKVTVSLPAELLARIEDRRHGREISRSEVVSELLWRGWRQAETEDREQRYRASYQAEPDTREEQSWADQAAADMLGEENSFCAPDDAGNDASS
jgi:Arc/MetJ-type ribon-helix-helix transcriptional regulator